MPKPKAPTAKPAGQSQLQIGSQYEESIQSLRAQIDQLRGEIAQLKSGQVKHAVKTKHQGDDGDKPVHKVGRVQSPNPFEQLIGNKPSAPSSGLATPYFSSSIFAAGRGDGSRQPNESEITGPGSQTGMSDEQWERLCARLAKQ